jgi:hypothetical protein
MREVRGVDGQLQRESITNVNVREDALLAMLADPFSLHIVLIAFRVEDACNARQTVGEEVDVNVRSATNMPGHCAADQPGLVRAKQSHQAKRLDAHLAQVIGPLVPFVQAREHLNLVADFRVGRKVGRLHPALAQAAAGLQLGPIIFRLVPLIHEPGCLKGDRPAKLLVGH